MPSMTTGFTGLPRLALSVSRKLTNAGEPKSPAVNAKCLLSIQPARKWLAASHVPLRFGGSDKSNTPTS